MHLHDHIAADPKRQEAGPHTPSAFSTRRWVNERQDPLPRGAPGGLLQGVQGLRSIHTGAPYEVDRRGVDLVDERVDAQVPRQLLVLF